MPCWDCFLWSLFIVQQMDSILFPFIAARNRLFDRPSGGQLQLTSAPSSSFEVVSKPGVKMNIGKEYETLCFERDFLICFHKLQFGRMSELAKFLVHVTNIYYQNCQTKKAFLSQRGASTECHLLLASWITTVSESRHTSPAGRLRSHCSLDCSITPTPSAWDSANS